MREFLLSVGYDRWILPALLIIPLGRELRAEFRHLPSGVVRFKATLVPRCPVREPP